MISTIAARRLTSGEGVVEYPLVSVEDGRISRIESLSAGDHQRVPATHRFPEATLAPAYVDIHIHGCAGHDVMEATPEALRADWRLRSGVAARIAAQLRLAFIWKGRFFRI
jgi:N-acetylglucosamine-6-phosphate deacetylase